MPVLPEEKTRDQIFAASLSHEMRTPLAAAQASAANLRLGLESLLAVVAAPSASAETLAEALPLLREALSDPSLAAPVTGLLPPERIAAIAVRLRAAGMSAGVEEAAESLLRGGWETRLDAVGSLLARHGADALLPALEIVGRLRANLRSLEASVGRMSGLVTALRVGLGSVEIAARPFDLRTCLEDALSTLRHEVPRGAAIDLACEEGLRLSGSPAQIQQVVVNLVENAFAALAPKGGRVAIAAARRAGGIVLSVADDGSGIPAGIQPRLFTPFFSTRPAGKGTGLGLYISRRIVENHGGTLTFVSAPGATRFEARFPEPRAGEAG